MADGIPPVRLKNFFNQSFFKTAKSWISSQSLQLPKVAKKLTTTISHILYFTFPFCLLSDKSFTFSLNSFKAV